MLQIGITGGIGSGKSLVCSIFKCLGIAVYCADSAAKKIMLENKFLVKQIRKFFGKNAYLSPNELNRSYLSDQIFQDERKKEKLEKLVHPFVKLHYQKWLKKHFKDSYVIKESAIIFESGTYHYLDRVITVYTPSSLQIKRIMERDKSKSKKEIKTIIKNQMPEDEKKKRADFIIRNDERKLLLQQILYLHKYFLIKKRNLLI